MAADVGEIGFESGDDADEARLEGSELVREAVSGFAGGLEGVL